MVPVLSPDLLPEYGSNVEASLDAAVEVALSGGYDQADFLLITDGVDSSAIKSIAEILSEAGDFRLSVLGVGTQDGAPIPTRNGGFAKRNDNVVIAKLDPSKLQGLASRHGGVYQTIRADDKDIESLIDTFNASFLDGSREIDRSFDLWDDQGYWLIILILPFTFFAFRRGIVASILIIPILLGSEPVRAYEWIDLWETQDQQAAKAMKEGNPEAAKSLFDNTQWRGSAAYKSGDYEEATNNFKNGNDSISHYNRGNALAKKGDLSGAIEAYDEALSTNSDFDDAAFNKKLVQRLKDQQNQDQQNQDQQNQDQQNQDQQNQDQQNQDQQNQDQQNQEMEKKDRPKEQLQQASEMTEAQKEEQQEIDRMLRRVPDDPGGLLRAKFRYQSKQRTRTPKPPTYQERW
jgi:Ca-activated chloride channel family protein